MGAIPPSLPVFHEGLSPPSSPLHVILSSLHTDCLLCSWANIKAHVLPPLHPLTSPLHTQWFHCLIVFCLMYILMFHTLLFCMFFLILSQSIGGKGLVKFFFKECWSIASASCWLGVKCHKRAHAHADTQNPHPCYKTWNGKLSLALSSFKLEWEAFSKGG